MTTVLEMKYDARCMRFMTFAKRHKKMQDWLFRKSDEDETSDVVILLHQINTLDRARWPVLLVSMIFHHCRLHTLLVFSL